MKMDKFKFKMELEIEAEDYEDAWVRWRQWLVKYADYLRGYQHESPLPIIKATCEKVDL